MEIVLSALTGTGVSGSGVDMEMEISDESLKELLIVAGAHNVKLESLGNGMNKVSVRGWQFEKDVQAPSAAAIDAAKAAISNSEQRYAESRTARIEAYRKEIQDKLGASLLSLFEPLIAEYTPAEKPLAVDSTGQWIRVSILDKALADEIAAIAAKSAKSGFAKV